MVMMYLIHPCLTRFAIALCAAVGCFPACSPVFVAWLDIPGQQPVAFSRGVGERLDEVRVVYCPAEPILVPVLRITLRVFPAQPGNLRDQVYGDFPAGRNSGGFRDARAEQDCIGSICVGQPNS